jgi:uncharacterized protein involved in tolerance to divalent cations
MILIHILSGDENQAIEIVDYLMEQKLILDSMMMERVKVRKKSNDGKINTFQQTLILGKTKSLLFVEIDNRLREKYKDSMPVLYSIPIVQMDWEQANELISQTARV